MATHATGTFSIDNWDENPILETEGGSKITKADVSRSFEGDLGLGDEDALAEATVDGDLPVGGEEVGDRAPVNDRYGGFAVAVAQPEPQPVATGVASHRPDDLADQRDLLGASLELTGLDRGRAPRESGVDEEDPEDGRDRERDHEPRRTALAGHEPILPGLRRPTGRAPPQASRLGSGRRPGIRYP
jgi:hypothetical protein